MQRFARHSLQGAAVWGARHWLKLSVMKYFQDAASTDAPVEVVRVSAVPFFILLSPPASRPSYGSVQMQYS